MTDHDATPAIRPSDVLAARTLITERGVLPGPDGHTAKQLVDALKLQGWGCTILPDGVVGFKRHVAPRTERPTLSVAGGRVLERLTVLLARAFDYDDRHR